MNPKQRRSLLSSLPESLLSGASVLTPTPLVTDAPRTARFCTWRRRDREQEISRGAETQSLDAPQIIYLQTWSLSDWLLEEEVGVTSCC